MYVGLWVFIHTSRGTNDMPNVYSIPMFEIP